jgi:hypothetical protein
MIQSANKKICKSIVVGGKGGVEFDTSFDDPAIRISIATGVFEDEVEEILAGIELTFYNGQARTGSFFERKGEKEDRTKPLELKTLSLENDAIKSIEVKEEEHGVFVDPNNLGVTHIRIETVKGKVLSSVDKSDNSGWVSLTDECGSSLRLMGLFGRSGFAIDKLGVYVS